MNRIKYISFKWKLTGIYLLITMLIAVPAGIVLYYVGVGQITDITKDMVFEIQQKNIQIFDASLSEIEEMSMQTVTNKELYQSLLKEKEIVNGNYQIINQDIAKILNEYFPSEDILSAQIITEKNVYGSNVNFLTADVFRKSEIYEKVMKEKGTLHWFMLYDIVDMFGLEEYRNISFANRYVFSVARTFGNGYIDSDGQYKEKAFDNNSQPVLLINFPVNLLDDIFLKDMSVPEASACLLSKSGQEVYSGGSDWLTESDIAEFWNWIKGKKQGKTIVNVNGEEVVLSYIRSEVTDWTSMVVIPSQKLMEESGGKLQTVTGGVMVVVIIAGFLFAALVSNMIMKPIKRTVTAMEKMGAGHFDTQISVKNRDEFGYLANGFNFMSQHIQSLIEENYISKLREKEMEIMALNLQINPHFLYNTLSVINYDALDNGCEKVSDMIMYLCEMLNYTFRSNHETALLSEELQWVQNYVMIMQYRFEDKFTVIYDIPEEMLNVRVPRLFLQPFVENSILHGFEYIESGGIIEVNGRKEADCCIIQVKDNGCGIADVEKLMCEKQIVGSIGIINIQKRIHLLYGEKYGIEVLAVPGSGTRIIVRLPIDSEQ